MKLLLALLTPTLFWAVYHYHKDRHQPEPLVNLLMLYGLGIGAGYIGLHAYAALELVGLRYDAYHLAETNRLGLFLYALGVIGIVEELVKFIPFWLVAMRLRHFDEPVDGIIYASFIALGFASYENLYFLPGLDGGEALARAFASPLVHIMFASIWGYACGRAKLQGRPLLPAALQGLGLAALLHGIYDFFAIGLSAWVHVMPPLIILGIWIWRMRLIRRLHLQALQEEPQNPGGK
jgi:RsiW-degrading membrane proteinase PrsW (M82 family)